MDKLKLNWKKEGKDFDRIMSKVEFLAAFEGLIKSFPEENQVSKRILDEIPKVKAVYINWDNTADVNCIYLESYDGLKWGIPIIHHHKIIWSILEAYCKV